MAEQKPPVNAGEEYDVRVEAVGEKGDGIVKVKGFVLFVPDVKAGDEIRINITKVLAKVGFAKKIGDAKGPISNPKRQKKPRRERPSDADIQAVMATAEPEITSEDSDDFGAELGDDDF